MIVLLDLNYTLVANSKDMRSKPAHVRHSEEQYRTWLIDVIKAMRPEHVFLVTIRPDHERDWTLTRIKEVTGWEPDRAYFNTLDGVKPEVWKRHVLETILIPEFGADPRRYLPIESNEDTQKMYREFGIVGLKAWPVNEPTEPSNARKPERSLFA